MYNPAVSLGLAASEWESFLSGHPEAHLLQSSAWAQLKEAFGWSSFQIRVGLSGAQVLFRRLPLGLKLAYVPKGPIGEWTSGLMLALDELCRMQRAFALKVEPDVPWDDETAAILASLGFRLSPHAIQPRRTLVIDLAGAEDDLLSRMNPKTRYNIRLASRRGVTVRAWSDTRAFSEMISETAERDQFGAHVASYYEKAYELFHVHGQCELLLAEYQGRPLAAIMVFARGRRAWYFYGASTTEERQRMPTYLLQWEAMRWAREKGCREYDLWGIPDEERETLEAEFTNRDDGLWSVYRFKRGFGGRVQRWAGAWDRPYNALVYWLYRLVLRWKAPE